MSQKRGFRMPILTQLVRSAGAMVPLMMGASALAHPHDDGTATEHEHNSNWVHENGIGPDADNDTNPATITGAISIVGDAALAADDPPYAVITFEPPPGGHGDVINNNFKDSLGVTFGGGLSRQICDGQDFFQYNTMCTYAAAPSGKYAAGYFSYLNRPLEIEFERPVCVVTMAIYPTGGKEGEPFEFKIEGWTENGTKLTDAKAEFEWTKNTVRWRHMAGAYFLDEPVTKIALSMKSKDATQSKKILRYLIDDFAFVENNCDEALAQIAVQAGDTLDDDDAVLTNAETETTGAADSTAAASASTE